jgi:hypothetical protein
MGCYDISVMTASLRPERKTQFGPTLLSWPPLYLSFHRDPKPSSLISRPPVSLSPSPFEHKPSRRPLPWQLHPWLTAGSSAVRDPSSVLPQPCSIHPSPPHRSKGPHPLSRAAYLSAFPPFLFGTFIGKGSPEEICAVKLRISASLFSPRIRLG